MDNGVDKRFSTISDEEKDKLESLRTSGKSWVEIGTLLGCDRRTAKRRYELFVAPSMDSNDKKDDEGDDDGHDEGEKSLKDALEEVNAESRASSRREGKGRSDEVKEKKVSDEDPAVLTEETKALLKSLRASGKSWVDIGKACGIDRRTAKRRHEALMERGSYARKKSEVYSSSMKPPEPGEESDANRTARAIRRRMSNASSSDLGSHWCSRKLLITEENRRKRVEWAKEHVEWTREQWYNVLWSDDCPFFYNVDKKSTVKAVVWGCFAASGMGKLCLIDGDLHKEEYISVLEDFMYPSAAALFSVKNACILQENNHPRHTSTAVKRWHEEQGTRLLAWPAQSPDLSPMQNLWSILSVRVKERQPTTRDQLFQTLEAGWNNFDSAALTKLVDSMPLRCQAVIDCEGYATQSTLAGDVEIPPEAPSYRDMASL
mmetsp:Transcript_14976/g.24785  ORF Transcript_14976/g.24785 Transcript_14976/m.24785 type:complete len:432 (-) Transcript_14976:194-1489(-)